MIKIALSIGKSRLQFIKQISNETAFVQTKRKLVDDCDMWCIVSLPGGVFIAAGADVKTNLMFFTRGKPTEKIWYYELSDIKVGKKTPLTAGHFEDLFDMFPRRADSPRSWIITRAEIESRNYDLKAVNLNAKVEEDLHTPEELLYLDEKRRPEQYQKSNSKSSKRSLCFPKLPQGGQRNST